jgi:hypothetical protein
MVKVIANEAVRSLLGGLEEYAEIRDAHGGLVGFFTPASAKDRLRAKILASYDPGEIARRKASGEMGRTTAEVLEHIRSFE